MKARVLSVVVLFSVFVAFRTFLTQAQPIDLPARGEVKFVSNLRAGPGANYAIMGKIQPGDVVDILDCDDACDWYQLTDGSWIFANLVDILPEIQSSPLISKTDVVTTTGAVTITVATWNVESGDADPEVIAERIAEFDGVDIWGLTEVNAPGNVATRDAEIYETAAEEGEEHSFEGVLSESGGGDRLLILYDDKRFEYLGSEELDAMNIRGSVRSPMYAHLRDKESGEEFIFMVNHLYRSSDAGRHTQAQMLNTWAISQTLPIIAVGDYNFDWDIRNGGLDHDEGYDLFTSEGVFEWVRPDGPLITTQCSDWPCRYNSVLDFVFTAGDAQTWDAESEIVVVAGDFPDSHLTSDHRPVVAQFVVDGSLPPPPPCEQLMSDLRSCPRPTVGASYHSGPADTDPIAAGHRGGCLQINARLPGNTWYKLASGSWISALFIEDSPRMWNPEDLARCIPAEVPTPTPTGSATPTPTFTPTSTPTPTDTATPTPTVTPTPTTGPGKVVIQYIFFDGDVPKVESDEYAVIENVGSGAVNLAGWRLNADDEGQDFIFADITLAPGESCWVYTNEYHPETCGLSFNSAKAIWANKGECGHLYDASGQEVDSSCY